MQIKVTSDYSLFQRISGNRAINKGHVKKLVQSIAEDTALTQYVPVIVNDKMQVIDGQHRLEAAKTLKIPVHYVVADGLTLGDVQRLNTRTKIWAPLDFAKSWVERGNAHYAAYLDFKKKFHLPHNVLIAYLSTGSGKTDTTREMFRNGKFKATNRAAAKWCEQLLSLTKYYPAAKQQVFALAFKKMVSHPSYKHQHLIEQMSKNKSLIKDCLTVEDSVRMLESIYNRHQGESKRVRFF